MSALTPRLCSYPRTDGRLCKSPALHDQRFCYYHPRDHDRRRRLEQNLQHRRSCIANGQFYELHSELPDGRPFDDNTCGLFADLQPQLLDDGNAIQQQLSSVYHAMSTQQVPIKFGLAMLWNLQLALGNLKNVRPPDFDCDRAATADITPIHRYPGFEDEWELEQQRQQADNAEGLSSESDLVSTAIQEATAELKE
jgi:hypothetical protein